MRLWRDPKKVHVPSDILAVRDPNRNPGLLGDKSKSFIVDNSKIKSLVPASTCTTPFSRGAQEIFVNYAAAGVKGVVDPQKDSLEDALYAEFGEN